MTAVHLTLEHPCISIIYHVEEPVNAAESRPFPSDNTRGCDQKDTRRCQLSMSGNFLKRDTPLQIFFCVHKSGKGNRTHTKLKAFGTCTTSLCDNCATILAG